MISALIVVLAVSGSADSFRSFDGKFDGPDIIYTEWLVDVLKTWPSKRSGGDGVEPFEITASRQATTTDTSVCCNA